MQTTRFTPEEIAAARTLPVRATTRVGASVTGRPVDFWNALRNRPDGPDYETTVGGVTIYRRSQLLHFMHKHLADPDPERKEIQ